MNANEELKKVREAVDAKLFQVNKVACENNLRYMVIAHRDIFNSGCVEFRTFYAEEFAEIAMLRDQFEQRYKEHRIQFTIYCG